jgi:DNA-binding response OmpR family regulator
MSRILLVDDDPDILETVQYALQSAGFTVHPERDGRSALLAARREPPDLALLDVMLPGMNGYEISRHLKADMRAGRLAPFPVVMLTARQVHSTARLEFLATWSQADASLWKPFELTALLGLVRRFLVASPAASAPGGSP